MKRPLLLELAYRSIEEVLQIQQKTNKEELTQQYPQLNVKLPTFIRIYLENEMIKEIYKDGLLIENIIDGAKELAFLQGKPLLLREYLACEIEIEIDTPEGKLTHRA
jgi:hypothetical protein